MKEEEKKQFLLLKDTETTTAKMEKSTKKLWMKFCEKAEKRFSIIKKEKK